MKLKKLLALLLSAVLVLGLLPAAALAAATNVTLYVLNGEEITLTYTDAEEGTTYIWKTASSLSNLKKANKATVIEGATTASCTVSASTKIYYGVFDSSGNTLLQSWAINVKDFTNDEASLSVDASALSGTLEYGSNREVKVTFGNASRYQSAEIYMDGQLTNYAPKPSDSGNAKILSYYPDTLTPGEHTLSFTVNYDGGISADHASLVSYKVESDAITYTVANEVARTATLSFENFDFSFSGVQILNFKKEADTTADNEEPITNYTFLIDESTPDNADFEIHIIPHEGFSYYLGLNYPILVNGTSYIWTSNLADKNVSRTLSASLEDGSKTVPFSVGMRTDPMSGMQQYFQFTFTKDETLFVEEQLTNAIPSEGQFENLNALITDKTTYLVIPFGQNTVDVTISIGDDFDGVKVNGGEKIDAVEGKVTATLNASTTGTDNSIIFTKQGVSTEVEYNVICTSQKFDAMPDAVTEYLCIGSQYTNGMGTDDYGLRPVRSLVGSNFDAGGNRVNGVGGSGPVSLGNFGGFITYYYENAITDNPNNPYGVDFITFGNSVEGSNEFGEPGQVWVSENGTDWYALAGGMHYEDYADWEYTITYTKNNDGTSSWTDSRGRSAKQDYKYPVPESYPYYDFSNGKDETIELRGIFFNPAGSTNEYGNTRPPFAGFGYTDQGQKRTILEGEEITSWSEEEQEIKFARNIAGNPYLGTYLSNNREFSAVTDGMDLAWAVDAQGQPVTFPNGVHYVKIVTASNIENGAIGEKSCEVNMVRVAQANDAPVGKTPAPASIYVDGADVALEAGKFVYGDVPVDGPFKVAVDVPEGTNVYINNNCATSANYDGMPTHKIVRVIVQEGEKEPAIYILNLKETASAAAPAATLTLDANGGTVNGSATYSMKFDANMSGDPLPEPVNSNRNVTFGGWFMGQRRFDAIPDEIQDTTLKALWVEKEKPEQDKTITVSFRLIGSTLTENGADIDLSDGDYHGAQYVTWIPTTRYTVPEDATIADLFLLATQRAGIRSVGADKGYVSTVYAPSGYELSEFTNGPRSGWMYTKNGEHTNAINVETMENGDVIVFHYVDDYAWEVEDWAWLGGTGWPQQSTAQKNFWNAWLKAPDTTGSSSGSLGGSTGDKKDEKTEGGATTSDSNTVTGDDGSQVTTVTEKTTETKENADGSVTEIVTETTKTTVTAPDGSTSVTETAVETETTTSSVKNADGTVTETEQTVEKVTETVTGPDGKQQTTVTETEETKQLNTTTGADGKVSGTGTYSATTTVTGADGKKTTAVTEGTVAVSTDDKGTVSAVTTAKTTTTAPDGTKTETVTVITEAEMANGTTGKVVADEQGNTISAEASVSQAALEAAAKSGEPIEIPVTVNPASGAAVRISLEGAAEGSKVWVEIGTTETAPGNVAYLKLAEGVTKLLTTCKTGSVIVPVTGDCEVIVKDNSKAFTDVDAGAWYVDSVKFVTAREIFNGVGSGAFAPSATMNRAMAAQILYNLDGSARAGDGTRFSDVTAGDWFNGAVGWASGLGVINGYNGAYAPLDAVTRQDLVTILYRYAKQAGYDVSAGSSVDLTRYADGADVAGYAAEAMRWAIAVGLIKGYEDNTLRPTATATRAEVAAIMQRMVQSTVK